jgi:hypothetical protein
MCSRTGAQNKPWTRSEELQQMSKQGHQLRELLAAGKPASYPGHPQFEEIQRLVLGEVLTTVEGAGQGWEKTRTNILTETTASGPLHITV